MIRASAKPRTWGRRQVLVLLGWQNSALTAGIIRYAGEARWALDMSYEVTGIPSADWHGDGILGLITSPKDYRAIQPFLSLPIVDLSKGWVCHLPPRMRQAGKQVPRVYYDNVAIARLAAEHLLERGFKEIAMFNQGNFWLETERMPEFRRRVMEGGGRFHEIAYYRHFDHFKLHPGQTRAGAENWLIEELRSLPKPLGIFISSDTISDRIFRACSRAELQVPEEVAVLGCDNDLHVCDFATIPVSSVDIGWETIGYEGARLLDRLMGGEPAPKEPIIVPPIGVVTRMSTNVMAVPDPKVARALRYIWEHFQEPIQIPDVAGVVGMNRRSLERAFAKYLNRSIATEIAHCRIEYAKRLLLESDLKAHEIAEKSGFSNIVHFSDAFLRYEGTRPSFYRKRHHPHLPGS